MPRRSPRAFVLPLLCQVILTASASAAIPRDADLSADLARWKHFGQVEDYIEANSLLLLESINWESDTLTFLWPDMIRWEVQVVDGVSWSDQQRQEAQRQLGELLREGFVESEVKQYFDLPAEQQAFDQLKNKAEAIIQFEDEPARPLDPEQSEAQTEECCTACCEPVWYMVRRRCLFARKGCWLLSCCSVAPTRRCGCGIVLPCCEPAEEPKTPEPTEEPQVVPSSDDATVAASNPPRSPVQFVTCQSIVKALVEPSLNAVPKSGYRDAELASQAFGVAFHAFWSGDYEAAERYLDTGLRMNPQDARLWYFKGLVAQALSRENDARFAFARAVRIHATLSETEASKVNRSLERVQGGLRRELHMALLFVRRASATGSPREAVPQQQEYVAAK